MPFIQDSTGQKVIPCIIAGKPVSLPDSTNFPIVQGSTGKTIHYAQTADVKTASAAADAAAEAFKTWRLTPAQERRKIINRFADILSGPRFEDAKKRKVTETSAPPAHGDFDVGAAVELAREAAASLMDACQGQIAAQTNPKATSLVFKEPVGPVLIIPPWNGAVVLPVRGICSALAAGCTVVMKASEMCPWTHQVILEVFEEAGLPPGCLNQVQASRDKAAQVTEALVGHPAIRKIEFIGSANVGRIVAQVAAKYLKPIFMELGDQSPLIVCDDADLKKAAQSVAFASNSLHGQICFGTERVYVQKEVADKFKAALVEAFKHVPSAGDAVSATSFKNGKAFIDEAVENGAQFVVGDGKSNGLAALKPVVLTNVDSKSRIADNEAFAPVSVLYTFGTDEEAVELANAKAGGLSASVYTRSFERGLKMSRLLEFGQVQVNEHTMYTAGNAPITGWKGSGWGSNSGRYGVEEFLQLKHVSLHDTGLY